MEGFRRASHIFKMKFSYYNDLVSIFKSSHVHRGFSTNVTGFAKTGHNSTFIENHFIAPSRFGH